jgi:hypothetical protein
MSSAHARLLSSLALFLVFTLNVSHCGSLNFICWTCWVLTRARNLSRTNSQAGGGFTCPMRMRAFCCHSLCALLSVHSVCISVLFIWVLTRATRLPRSNSQAGGGFTCLTRMRASKSSFCMYLTAVYVTLSVESSGCLLALGVYHALTARQEEVSPVQCACGPFVPVCSLLGVHSMCISLLFA